MDLYRFSLRPLCSFHSLVKGTPLTNQEIVGIGSPLTRQVRIPVSFGARIRFLGALIQKGAANKEEKQRCQGSICILVKINIIYYNVIYIQVKQYFDLTTDSFCRPYSC